MAAKKKQQTAEELQNGAGTPENGAQSVEEVKDKQTPTEENGAGNGTNKPTESAPETEPAPPSDPTPPTPPDPPAPAITIDEFESLLLPGDMDATEEAQSERWRIADDGCADWALKKIKAEKDELDRLTELADKEIARITEQKEKAQRRYEQNTAFLTSMLAEYFGTVPHKKTKTGTETYRLLNGQLTLKPAQLKLEQDDAALVEYLEKNHPEYVKVEKKAAWGDFKKTLATVGTVVMIEETGEIVEGVNAVETAPQFSVKF